MGGIHHPKGRLNGGGTMSCWRIEIRGRGAQHEDPTQPRPHNGADALALRLIDQLRAAGHDLQIARFIHFPDHEGKESTENLLEISQASRLH
jgi:hypothetical protein